MSTHYPLTADEITDLETKLGKSSTVWQQKCYSELMNFLGRTPTKDEVGNMATDAGLAVLVQNDPNFQ